MSNTAAPTESKTAKKRKAKAEQALASGDTASHSSDPAAPATTQPNGESPTDSAYMKDLSRQIRNVQKKLTASAKADAVIAENPGKSLNELVADKKLNNDQKTQIQKKPGLQTQLAQLEEQLGQYRTFAQDLEERFSREKTTLIESHEQEVARLKEEIATQTQAPEPAVKDIDEELKVISHFLHAAASKRQSESADTDEGRAFEGILLQVYQGNDTALSTLRNLINGSEEKVNDTENNPLDFTYAQVKQAALAEAAELAAGTEDGAVATESSTDPTIANAGLTELDDTTTIPIRSNGPPDNEPTLAPEQVSTTDDAANAVAESSWNPDASMTTDASANTNGEEWVQVPRDPAETDTGLTATPAAQQTESWAEEVATSAAEEKPRTENDGFEPVRGRHGEGRGGRGRGGRGGGGHRGEFRGRGRGGGRGEGFRGGRGGRGGERGERSERGPRGPRGEGRGGSQS